MSLFGEYSMKTFMATIIAGLVLGPSIFFGVFSIGWEKHTGHGTHVGYVTAVEMDGVFWQTPNLYFKTDAQSSQEDNYCIDWKQPDLIHTLRSYAENRTRVEIAYDSYLKTHPWHCGPDSVIVGVREVNV